MFIFDVWCETRVVLSPLLFSVYVNDMIQKLCDTSLGCYVGDVQITFGRRRMNWLVNLFSTLCCSMILLLTNNERFKP